MRSTIAKCVVLFIVEGEVFQIKKPSHSKRIVKQLKKESLRDKSDEPPPVKFEVCFAAEQVRCIYVWSLPYTCLKTRHIISKLLSIWPSVCVCIYLWSLLLVSGG